MINLFKTVFWYIIKGVCTVLLYMLKCILVAQEAYDEAVWIEPRSLEFVSDHLQTKDMCIKAVRRSSYTLYYVTDRLRIQEMYNKIMHIIPDVFHHISDHFKIQEMYNKTVEVDTWQLKDVPNHFKAQEMCNKAVGYTSFLCSLSLIGL